MENYHKGAEAHIDFWKDKDKNFWRGVTKCYGRSRVVKSMVMKGWDSVEAKIYLSRLDKIEQKDKEQERYKNSMENYHKGAEALGKLFTDFEDEYKGTEEKDADFWRKVAICFELSGIKKSMRMEGWGEEEQREYLKCFGKDLKCFDQEHRIK